MKAMGMHLDFKTDTARIADEEINLSCMTSGHYCLPLNVFQVDACNIVLKVREIEQLDKKEKMAKALKLHRQFGHASADKLVKLLNDSNIKDAALSKCVQEVCNNCELCRKYKPAPLKPTVSLPLASSFNQVVCLDLKEYKHNKQWIPHMIDASTRYSAARLISTKRKDCEKYL